MTGDPPRPVGPLRISFVALNYPPSVGGAQEHVRRVAEGLAGLGHDVEVLTTDALRSPSSKDPGRVAPRTEVRAGVRVRRHRVPRWLSQPHRWLRWANLHAPWSGEGAADAAVHPAFAGPMAPALWRATWRALRRRDVVVGVSAPFLTLVLPPRLARPGAAATVGMPLLHAGRDAPHGMVASSLRRCRGTSASTPFEAELQACLGVDPDRIRVLPPGTDLPADPPGCPASVRRDLGLPDRPTVGYVGRLAAYKGVDTFLDAAMLLWESHPDATVLVAGATTGWTDHRTHPAHGRAHGRLVVREDFADDERADLLAACDVVACPSRDESFGLGILEAWAVGRPVVASDLVAVRDVVRPGTDGLLVPTGSASHLAEALRSLLDDPDRARALGAAGRDHLARDLSWPAIVARWQELLELVTEPAGARGAEA